MPVKNKKQKIQKILKRVFSFVAIFSMLFSNLSPILAASLQTEKPNQFSRGVLAVNTLKAIYEPGETVVVQMASLDNTGHTLRNSNLTLEITGPDKTAVTYKSNKSHEPYETNNQISNNSTCGDDNVTDEPDYTAEFKATTEGAYEIKLINQDAGLEVSNIFQVKKDPPFVVERKTATRINPFKSAYNVNIQITARKDFIGQAEELVQDNFTLSNNGTVVFAPTATSTIAGSAVSNFYNLTSNSAGKELRFKNGQQLGVAGTLTLAGINGSPLDILSDSAGVQWLLNLTGTASYSYIRVKDCGCAAGSVAVNETVSDRGNNTASCWGLVVRGGGGGGAAP